MKGEFIFTEEKLSLVEVSLLEKLFFLQTLSLQTLSEGEKQGGTDVEDSGESYGDLLLVEEVEAEVAFPAMVKVIIHNDNYTAMDFVVRMLKKYFHKNEAEAKQIMLSVHKDGHGVAGIYIREIAETKIFQVMQEAKQNEFPLRLSIEDEKQ